MRVKLSWAVVKVRKSFYAFVFFRLLPMLFLHIPGTIYAITMHA